jgi:dipeptide/tripeptide permease
LTSIPTRFEEQTEFSCYHKKQPLRPLSLCLINFIFTKKKKKNQKNAVGYLLSQIPGGYASSILGGRRTLPAGVGLWSLATAGVPVFAATLPGLFLSRAVVGLGEGVAPSAATDIVARCIDSTERSRAISFIFAG